MLANVRFSFKKTTNTLGCNGYFVHSKCSVCTNVY